MRKFSFAIKAKVISLTKRGIWIGKTASQLKLVLSTVVVIRKRSNVVGIPNVGVFPRLLTNAVSRQIVKRLTKTDNRKPKDPALARSKTISEWTTRGALQRIGFVNAVKQKKPALSNKNIKARLKFCNIKIGPWKTGKRLTGRTKRK